MLGFGRTSLHISGCAPYPYLPVGWAISILDASVGFDSIAGTWADQSGNNNGMTFTGGSPPTSTLNGQTTLMGGSGSVGVYNNTATTMLGAATSAERLMVILPYNSSTVSAPFTLSPWGVAGQDEWIIYQDGNTYSDFCSTARPGVTASPPYPSPILLDQVSGGGTTTWWSNGNQFYTGANTFAISTLAPSIFTSHWAGQVAFCAVGNRALTTGERATATTAILARYGL